MTWITRSNDEDDRAVHDWILLNENSRWYCGISDARNQYIANEEHHAEVTHLPFTWPCEVLILNVSIIHGNLFIFEIPKGPSDLIDFQKLFLEIDLACYTTANGYSSSLDYLTLRLPQWASCQIRKIAGCACAGNAGNVFPRHRLKRKLLVSDPGMHHGTCVTHVPWCMSGSLTRGGGENVPGIPSACATGKFTYLARVPWFIRDYPHTHSDALGLETSVMDYHRLLHRNVPNQCAGLLGMTLKDKLFVFI